MGAPNPELSSSTRTLKGTARFLAVSVIPGATKQGDVDRRRCLGLYFHTLRESNTQLQFFG
jgi:hypothetical protein